MPVRNAERDDFAAPREVQVVTEMSHPMDARAATDPRCTHLKLLSNRSGPENAAGRAWLGLVAISSNRLFPKCLFGHDLSLI